MLFFPKTKWSIRDKYKDILNFCDTKHQSLKTRYFSKEDIQMAKRHMQTKITMRYHLILVRMAIIKKSTNNKFLRGCKENRTLLYCWWKCKLIQLPRRTICCFLKKLKIELPYDPAIPLLGPYTEKTVTQKTPTS